MPASVPPLHRDQSPPERYRCRGACGRHWPVLLLVALAIRLESHGPVFERHSRVNRAGRRFEALNFRVAEQDQSRTWARKVTRVGSFLLHTRIVSLPQILNVLRGEISLIEIEDHSPSFWA